MRHLGAGTLAMAGTPAVTDSARDSFANYRERLDALGFRPSSTRGQNFLLDPTLHRVIAGAAESSDRDVVLEIGVGLGFLTRELALVAGFVLGVEIDSRLHAVASEDLASFRNVEIVRADALSGPGGSLPEVVRTRLDQALTDREEFLVVGNLPYAASGPLLAELFCLPRLPDRIVVLVQRELGDRLAAKAGSEDYGGLSALLQSAYAVERLRTVGAEVFRPRPKVASAIVRLRRRADTDRFQPADRRALQQFVRVLFGKRRKVLRTTVTEAAAAIGSGFPDLPESVLQRRAETLAPDEMVELFHAVRAAGPA